METVRISRPAGCAVVCICRAGNLNWLDGTGVRVEVQSAAGGRGRAESGVTGHDAETSWEGSDVVVGLVEVIVDVHIEHRDAGEVIVGTEVEIRDPVVAFVVSDDGVGAGGAGC